MAPLGGILGPVSQGMSPWSPWGDPLYIPVLPGILISSPITPGGGDLKESMRFLQIAIPCLFGNI